MCVCEERPGPCGSWREKRLPAAGQGLRAVACNQTAGTTRRRYTNMCGSDARALEPLSKRKCLATAREPRPLSARELDARVDRHDAAGEVAVAHEAEAGIARQVRELLLRVELLDALDEVLVRRAVVGHQPA